MFHDISHKPKGGWQQPRQVMVNKSTVQIWEKKATQKFANKYRDILQNNMAEGPKDPQGPFFYQEGGKTYASLPMEMLQNIQKSHFSRKCKRLQGRRHRNPQDINGKGPGDPCINSTGIFTKHGSRDNASDGQSSNDEGNGRKCDHEQPDQVLMMEFRDIERPIPSTTPKPQNTSNSCSITN